MFESDKKSPLDRLKKDLYSRKQSIKENPRHDIHESTDDVPEAWSNDESSDTETPSAISAGMKKIYKALFLSSAVFFLIALAIGAYTIFGGRNFVSVDNIDITVEGPVSIAGGEPLELTVSVLNKNATDIELVDLIVEYPEGTKDPLAPEKDLSRARLSLGTIGSQAVVQKSLSSIMFGEEGTEREIKFTAEYRTAGSNAIFFKEKTYYISISSSPVIVSISALDKVVSNQATNISITISSNSSTPVNNLLLSLDYPFGFSVISSNPVATYGNNIWRIGDLAPGAKKTINIMASTLAQDDEERNIRASVGIQSQSNEREIATTIISRDHTFIIERPFLGLDLTLNGDRKDLATEASKTVRAEILWMNNSQSKITNARIEAKLSGNVLDKNSVSPDSGYYDSSTNTIVWEGSRLSSLASISPGDDGRIGFTFKSLPTSPGQSIADPIITIVVSASGSRIDETGAPAEIATGISRSVKLVSNLALSARALRSQGPFQNTGPIPPQAEQSTTYTVIWTVTNTSNVVTGAKVTATLPVSVIWAENVSPVDANIVYNRDDGVITWIVGDVPRNADINSGAKQVAFQVSLLPSVTQIGQTLGLLNASTITGTDVFTGATIQNSAPALSTRTTTDLLWKPGNEIVQP